MAQDYAQYGEKVMDRPRPRPFAIIVLDEEDVEVLEDLDTEQQTVIARQTDITKRVRVNNQEAISYMSSCNSARVHLKPMWGPKRTISRIPRRRIPDPCLPPTSFISIHPLAEMIPGGYTYEWNGYEHTNRYKVIRFIEIEGQAVLERQAPGLLPFTPLMQPPAGMPPE